MMDTIHKRHYQGYPRSREVTHLPGTYLDYDDVNAPYGHLIQEGCLAPSRHGRVFADGRGVVPAPRYSQPECVKS